MLLGGAGLSAQEQATPKNGEGIELFLKRFGREGAAYRKAFIQLNKGKFGKNYSEEELDNDEIQAIKDYYPMNISEANAKY